MSLRNVLGMAALAVLIITSSTTALAQGGKQPKGKQQAKPEPVSNLKGTIEQVGRGMIQISAGSNETYIVYVMQPQKLRVTGTAESSFLHSGALVQFSALVDKGKVGKGKGKDAKIEVKKLTIVTLDPPEIVAGAIPDPGGGAGEGTATPQIVVGTITTLKGNAATVNVPGLSPKLQIEIADSASIDVNVDGYLMAQKGDGIEITKGAKIAGQGGGIIQCAAGKITLMQPLAGAKKRGGAHAGAHVAHKPDDSAEKSAAKPDDKDKDKGKDKDSKDK